MFLENRFMNMPQMQKSSWPSANFHKRMHQSFMSSLPLLPSPPNYPLIHPPISVIAVSVRKPFLKPFVVLLIIHGQQMDSSSSSTAHRPPHRNFQSIVLCLSCNNQRWRRRQPFKLKSNSHPPESGQQSKGYSRRAIYLPFFKQ